MSMAGEQYLKALVLGPQEYRLGQPLDVLGQPTLVKPAGADTNNAVAVMHLTAPKMTGPPLHRHSREEEWFYVLHGEVTVEIERKRVTGIPGASIFIPRGTVHTFQNFKDETAQMLVMVTPAGLERFFEDLHALNKGLAEPDFPGVQRLMGDYGLELLGPPLMP